VEWYDVDHMLTISDSNIILLIFLLIAPFWCVNLFHLLLSS